MVFELGLLELLGFATSLVIGGWTLLKLSLNQFERRLDDRFKVLDAAVADVKRLEMEIVRSDNRNTLMFVTKVEHEKLLNRIFEILEVMDKKLDSKSNVFDRDKLMDTKVNKAECELMRHQKADANECPTKHETVLRTLGRT